MYRTFKGTLAEYRAIHRWAEKTLGTPMACDNCDSDNMARYEWANISGEYKQDKTDWLRLCISCHRKMDSTKGYKTECRNGHLYTQDNTYVNKLGYKSCVECRAKSRFSYRTKQSIKGAL